MENYEALMARALDEGLVDPARLALYDRMNDLNRHLCLTFIQHHHLTGVEQPMPLFRLASSAIHLGNPRFAELLALLTAGAPHLTEALALLALTCSPPLPSSSLRFDLEVREIVSFRMLRGGINLNPLLPTPQSL
jgi:hypothetical protein